MRERDERRENTKNILVFQTESKHHSFSPTVACSCDPPSPPRALKSLLGLFSPLFPRFVSVRVVAATVVPRLQQPCFEFRWRTSAHGGSSSYYISTSTWRHRICFESKQIAAQYIKVSLTAVLLVYAPNTNNDRLSQGRVWQICCWAESPTAGTWQNGCAEQTDRYSLRRTVRTIRDPSEGGDLVVAF